MKKVLLFAFTTLVLVLAAAAGVSAQQQSEEVIKAQDASVRTDVPEKYVPLIGKWAGEVTVTELSGRVTSTSVITLVIDGPPLVAKFQTTGPQGATWQSAIDGDKKFIMNASKGEPREYTLVKKRGKLKLETQFRAMYAGAYERIVTIELEKQQ